MNNQKIVIPLPTVYFTCPHCDSNMTLESYDFEPCEEDHCYAKSTAIYCETCDKEIDVYLGGA